MSIDEAAEKYRLPDLHPAFVEFIHCNTPSNSAPYLNGGWCSTAAHSDLGSMNIQVWSGVHLQSKSFHNTDEVVPFKLANVCPPCEDWPLGLCDSVIINTDRSKTWPQSRLAGEWDSAGFNKWCTTNTYAWTGHHVAQLQLILQVIPPKGATQSISDIFLTYAQHFDVVPQWWACSCSIVICIPLYFCLSIILSSPVLHTKKKEVFPQSPDLVSLFNLIALCHLLQHILTSPHFTPLPHFVPSPCFISSPHLIPSYHLIPSHCSVLHTFTLLYLCCFFTSPCPVVLLFPLVTDSSLPI